MAFVCTLASGSDGNCVLVSDGRTRLLVDAGISARRISRALREFSLDISDISAVLVTHEHGDHIYGLSALKKPVFAAELTCAALKCEATPIEPGRAFTVGSVGVTPFATPHDTPQSLGYLLHAGGLRVAVCTDLGHMPPEALAVLCTANVLLLEANHDVQMLRRGPYPAFLKDRILGKRGHLSNDACADAVAACARHGVGRVTLCHLSKDNNSPDLALGTVAHRLHTEGIKVGSDIFVDVAPHGELGAPYGERP